MGKWTIIVGRHADEVLQRCKAALEAPGALYNLPTDTIAENVLDELYVDRDWAMQYDAEVMMEFVYDTVEEEAAQMKYDDSRMD